ncbi:MAG TPA: alpha/beta hydrolase [Fontimonas sp.]
MFLAAPLAQGDEYRTFESDGTRLAYVDEGSGTPVLFLHGFQGSFVQGLAPVADALKGEFRIVGLDQRGHGRSDRPHGEHDYGLHFADDVLNLMNERGIDKAHLVGHSMGGITAMYLAAHFPQRFHSVTTIGNGLFTNTELRLVGWLFRGKFLWIEFKSLLGIGAPPDPQQDLQADRRIVASLQALTVTPTEAAAIRLPVLAARGGPDDDPNDTVERLVATNAAVQKLRIESADHMTILADRAFLGALKDFLTAHSPPPASAGAGETNGGAQP